MLKIKNLHASVAGKEILKGLNLEIKAGEIHAIMGPNGAGKSTLGNVLAGREGYEVTQGEITFNGKNLLELEPEERACEGVFLAFQYPVEIPGVNNTYFLRAALNAQRKYRGEEIFQMAVLEPALAILDETDSGLDIDALKTVAEGVNRLRSPDRGMIVVTHYQRLLDYIVPDKVHVLADGKLVATGGADLALKLEEQGYAWLEDGGIETLNGGSAGQTLNP